MKLTYAIDSANNKCGLSEYATVLNSFCIIDKLVLNDDAPMPNFRLGNNVKFSYIVVNNGNDFKDRKRSTTVLIANNDNNVYGTFYDSSKGELEYSYSNTTKEYTLNHLGRGIPTGDLQDASFLATHGFSISGGAT